MRLPPVLPDELLGNGRHGYRIYLFIPVGYLTHVGMVNYWTERVWPVQLGEARRDHEARCSSCKLIVCFMPQECHNVMSCWIQFSGQCSPNNYRLRKYQVTNERCVDISARRYARIITTQQHIACTADFIVFQSCVNELEKQPHGKASRQTWPLDFCYAFVCVIFFTKPSPHYQVHHSPLQLSSGTRASLWLLDKICEWPGNEVTSWAQLTRVKHYNYRFLKLKVFFSCSGTINPVCL